MRSVHGTQKLKLGDVRVARIGLGTNRLTTTTGHVDLVRQAVAAGVGMIDTARTYAGGESEETIAAALAGAAEGCIVATKGGWASGRAEAIKSEAEESLRRLRVEKIDLFYLHRPDSGTPIEESVGALRELRESGKIEHVGLSNVDVGQIERAREIVPVAAVQNHYSLSERQHEEVVDYCTREEIVFVPYFPLRGIGGRKLGEVAGRHGATSAQIALAWLLRRSPVTLPIPGTLSLDHLRENLGALDLELGEDDFQALR